MRKNIHLLPLNLIWNIFGLNFVG